MADPIYDIAAISTNTSGAPAVAYVISTLSSADGTTRAHMLMAGMHSALSSAGWTTITSSTATVEMYGIQSPWYDPDAVPSWYTSTDNIPWVRFTPGSTVVSVVYGHWDGTAGTHTSSIAMNGSQGGNNSVWHLIASPYQFAFRNGGSPFGFLMSALHIPDFVQERAQVRNAMIGISQGAAFTAHFLVTGNNAWTLYESNLGTAGVQTWTGNANGGLIMAYQCGGGLRASTPSGSYIWNPADTNMATQGDWWPLIMPPIVGWQIGTAIPTATNTPTAIGMLWDSVMINRNYTTVSTFVGIPEEPAEQRRDWLVFGSSTLEFPASLLFIIGTSA